MVEIKWKKCWMELTVALFFICVAAGSFRLEVLALGHHDYSTEELTGIIGDVIQWKKSQNGVRKEEPLFQEHFLAQAGTTAGDWTAVAIGRSGWEEDNQAYLAVLADRVSKKYQKDGGLDSIKATEWHRAALAVLALGGDPCRIGTDADGNPINLIADGVYYRGRTENLGAQGVNGWIYGLLVLDSMDFEVPEDALDTRESIVNQLLEVQLENGGYNLDGNGEEADTDLTAMALQALAPHKNEKKVKSAVEKGIAFLSEAQQEDGGYESGGMANAESTAQVLIALAALGIDPGNDGRFLKNGCTVMDGLIQYRMEDGGFIHSREYDASNPQSDPDLGNDMAGDQAMLALTALCRYYGNYRSLYDFRPEPGTEKTASLFGEARVIHANIVFTEEDAELVKELPERMTTENYLEVVKLLDKYQKCVNRQDYIQYGDTLKKKREEIQRIQDAIDRINGEVAERLYPVSEITLEDQTAVKEIQKEMEALSAYDRTKILEYEELDRAEARIRTQWITRIGTLAGIILAGILVCVVAVRSAGRRKAGRQEYEEDEA